jgi:hypothetical protein
MKKLIDSVRTKSITSVFKTKQILTGNSGEGFVDTAISILICVVIGALLLAGLYTLFGETVLFSSRYKHDRKCYA